MTQTNVRPAPITTEAPPLFEHDCDACTYLGRFEPTAHYSVADLYYCDHNSPFPTVIARISSRGPDYASGMPYSDSDRDNIEPLLVAAREAYRLGLDTGDYFGPTRFATLSA
jgi:hypothetical protein